MIRLYHLEAVNDRTGARTRLTSYADTHEHCLTMRRRFTAHPDVRIVLVEADHG